MRTDAIKARMAQVAADMTRNLRHHRMDCRLDRGVFRNYRCANPERQAYHFNVSTEPGRLIVTGDCGDLILERSYDMLAWARGAIENPYYFGSKKIPSMQVREFDPEVAREWLIAEQKQNQREAEEWLTNWREANGDKLLPADWKQPETIDVEGLTQLAREDEHGFYMELYENGIVPDGDFPDFNNYTHEYLRCREAVKWLLARLPEHADYMI